MTVDDNVVDGESKGASRPHELSEFTYLQRSLAAINFPAIQAAQRALDGSGLAHLAETRKAIARIRRLPRTASLLQDTGTRGDFQVNFSFH